MCFMSIENDVNENCFMMSYLPLTMKYLKNLKKLLKVQNDFEKRKVDYNYLIKENSSLQEKNILDLIQTVHKFT